MRETREFDSLSGERGKKHSTVGECCQSGYSESDWVDFQLGSPDGQPRQAMKAHAAKCPACQELQDRWSNLLEYDENGGKEPADEVRDGTDGDSPYVADKRYRALKREVIRLGRKRSRRSWTVLGGGLTAAVVFLLLAAAVMKGGEHPVSLPAPLEATDMHVLEKDPHALEVLLARGADRMDLSPPMESSSRGVVWFSADNSKGFLLLEDVPSASRSDYQVWVISGEQRNSLGLLKQIGTRGYLDFNTIKLQGSETISVSAEPRGGSRYPTTDQIVLMMYRTK